MRFSLVVPTYNEEKNINLLMLNLCQLSYPKDQYEIIIQDDCSQDRTYEIAKNIKTWTLKIKVFQNSQNLGIAHNRNEGAKNAEGEIMIQMDADCLYPCNILQIIDNDFKQYKLIALSGILMPRTDENPTYLDLGIFLGFATMWQYIGGTCNLFCVKSDIFRELGGFQEPMGIKGREDLDLWYRLENKYGRDKLKIDNLLISYISLRRARHSRSNNISDILADYMKIASGYWVNKGYGRVE